MPISATGISTNTEPQRALRTSSPQGGFTLLELVVVLALIGIMSGAVLVGLGALRGHRLDAERERFTVVINLAAHDASLNGRVLGLFVAQDRYRVARYAVAGWTPIDDEPLYDEWQLAAPVRIADDRPRNISAVTPVIVFLPESVVEVPALQLEDTEEGDAVVLRLREDGTLAFVAMDKRG